MKRNENGDWETTGQEEMNKLYEYTKGNTRICNANDKPNISILDARDKLNTLKDLVDMCVTFALKIEDSRQNKIVANVLYDFVYQGIVDLEKELAKL